MILQNPADQRILHLSDGRQVTLMEWKQIEQQQRQQQLQQQQQQQQNLNNTTNSNIPPLIANQNRLVLKLKIPSIVIKLCNYC